VPITKGSIGIFYEEAEKRMNAFHFQNKTEIFFGRGAVTHLAEKVVPYQNILLVYGGGSIKQNGVYRDVMAQLGGKTIIELSGVTPNPRIEKVYEGIALCEAHHISFILAVGGGSVIDCAKFIAAGAKLPAGLDVWQRLAIEKHWVQEGEALPLGVVSTMAATGSEMNEDAVITNWDAHLKLSGGGDGCYPQFAILDPVYTFSMPRTQMIYGCVDIFSHIFEAYFSKPDDHNVSDYLAEGLMRCLIENLNVALVHPQDYTARANIMWCSTMALNGLIGCSKEQDWMSHGIEHALSAFYDIPHGAGLSVVHPNYMRFIYPYAPEKFARYAVTVWGIDPTGQTTEALAQAGIARTRAYFNEIGAPATLADVGIPVEMIPTIAATIKPRNISYTTLTQADMIKILEMCV